MSFAATLPIELSRLTDRKVELYNLATGGMFRGGSFPTRRSSVQFTEALSMNPDMVLWIVTPLDIKDTDSGDLASSNVAKPRTASPDMGRGSRGFLTKLRDSIANGSFLNRLLYRWQDSRTKFVLNHFLIANETEDQYISACVRDNVDADFLQTNRTARWMRLLHIFQEDARDFNRQAMAANVPLVGVLVPSRGQAAMLSRGKWPQGYDPYMLDREVQAAISNDGGIYIDILRYFRATPGTEHYYFPYDGHLNSEGHAMTSSFLAHALTSGAIPALKAATPQLAASNGY
jgi:hypothetical protein